MNPPSISFDETSRELLKDPETAVLYLAEFLEDGDSELFQLALKHVTAAVLGDVRSLPDSILLE